jgi:anti-sigma factor RsiW
MDCASVQDLCHAYLDHELAPSGLMTVEAHLDHCPACLSHFAAFEGLTEKMQLGLPRYDMPDGLRERIRSSLGLRSEGARAIGLNMLFAARMRVAMAASLLLGVVASALATFTYLHTSPEQAVVQDIVSGHIRSLVTDHATDIASADQQRVESWLATRAGVRAPALDLPGAGYRLIGGRVDSVDGRRAAVLVYAGKDQVIDMFVCAPQTPEAETSKSFSARGYNVVYFGEQGLDFWLVSDADAHALDDFASQVRSGLHAS